MLDGVTIINRSTDETRNLGVCGLFVMIGAEPCTGWLRRTVALDEKGFVRTGAALKTSSDKSDIAGAALSPFRTNLPGVFAVGDVRSGSVKRVASAVGEGSVAGPGHSSAPRSLREALSGALASLAASRSLTG